MNKLSSEASDYIKKYLDNKSSMMPVVMKALIHDEVIPALQSSGLLSRIVFQGGTALQRFYNNMRFSEDLDFVCGQGKSITVLPEEFIEFGERFEKDIRDVLEKKYEISPEKITLRQPKDPYALKGQDVKVQVWRLKVPVTLNRQKQMVKVEVANVPAHQTDNQFWPMLQGKPTSNFTKPCLLKVETSREILADKLIALACRNQVKYRDVWDYHILTSQGIAIDQNLVDLKFEDYGINKEPLLDHLEDKLSLLSDNKKASKEFWTEMSKFVFPGAVEQYKIVHLETEMINKVYQLLTNMTEQLEKELGFGQRM